MTKENNKVIHFRKRRRREGKVLTVMKGRTRLEVNSEEMLQIYPVPQNIL